MALMLGKTYDALVAAGAPEDKARDAAEELAEYETRFATMANDITLIKGDIVGIKGEMAGIKGDMTALKWMVGINFAATMAILVKLFV
jgi:ABC-type sugar transport system ATPase subunit